MRWQRLLAVAVALWLLALGIMLQPHRHTPPKILHARLLDLPSSNLPTLGPAPR